jgi:hypothetical protein
VPQQIGDLKHLEILSLFNNEIEGQIQTLFMKLMLKILLLNSNKLNGKLSADIANLNVEKMVCLKITWTARFLCFGGHE